MNVVSIGKLARALGVCVATLRRWHKEGKLIPDFVTDGAHRRYNVDRVRTEFSLLKDDRITVAYCRVSSHDQKSDLEKQEQVLADELRSTPNKTIIRDLGSGINFKKRGLTELLNLIMTGQVQEVVITHKDRLVRFGYELIEKIAKFFGTKITILMGEEKILTFEEELAKDLITIITVFSSRLYGKRSHKNKKILAAIKA